MKTALVIVDVQNDYFPGGRMELENSLEASECARHLLDHFRKAHLPLFHIQHIAIKPGSTFFLPNTDGVEIHKNLKPLKGERVIQKHFPNAFRETLLSEGLRSEGINRLVICGMMTHMCVDATVRAATDLGFECLIAQDACATRALSFGGVTVPADHVHRAFLAALDGSYGKVGRTDELLSALVANAE